MSLTKQKILDSAMRFFLEKGYLATSIQNIADDCGVAKGSLYNFFSSKEDIFIDVLLMQQRKMTEEIEHIRANPKFSIKDVFIQETVCQIEFFLKHSFIMQEMKKLMLPDGKIAPFLSRSRVNLLKYNRDSLIRIFGEDIKPNVWDLVTIYNGIMREFIFLTIFDHKSLVTQEVAVFIVQCMEDMANNTIAHKRPSLLKESDMSEYIQCGMQGEQVPDMTQILHLIQRLQSTIKELPVPNAQKTELQEATLLIQEEMECDNPKIVIVRALIVFLEKESHLKDILKQLEKLVINYS
ncbi:TetR/AcrR family transcriptional regulator [Paenibacillus pini]|uniref:Transcriptional regulator n=1 Tax=Paenibacillus pini JCM 16418 TaxID=1236976 RepID=W7YUX0_9BACL|nr:TetR/AcrR family transcriptional regulator [Paenibacillus pini]GAF06244.1 transcriptional regulator [Paenibacillus pini JCM 16418]